jgi:hypothetical protein
MKNSRIPRKLEGVLWSATARLSLLMMKKAFAAIALALTFGILIPAKPPHHHHQEPLRAKASNVSETKAWRHVLLLIAQDMTSPVQERLAGDLLTIITTARNFRAEFEKSIDDFNTAQESRIEADQLEALKNFIAQRDEMVAKYKSDLLSALKPSMKTRFLDDLEKSKIWMKSSGAAGACGVPDYITCSITYSMFPLAQGCTQTAPLA